MSSKILDASAGIVSKATDYALYLFFLNINLLGSMNMRQAEKAVWKTLDEYEGIDKNTLLRAFRELRNKGLIRAIKDSSKEFEITEMGRRKLDSLFPVYQKVRPWDGKIYLVTYDVPISCNFKRDSLRNYLKKIGCGMLQQSIWLTPFNPTTLIKEFVQTYGSSGTILVSELGRDGSIGGMTQEELIENVYNLSKLNDQYIDFIHEVSIKEMTSLQLGFLYLSVLKNDPQAPFELLPNWWQGDRAYEVYAKLLKQAVCKLQSPRQK